jgi:predicted nucleic acid-binding protein
VIFALDSNIILYAEGINDEKRRDLANRLIISIGVSNLLIPMQVLGETVRAFVKQMPLKKHEAVARLAPWFNSLKTQDTTRAVFEEAMTLVRHHHFQVWDAIVLSAAKAGGASVLFSEDMQDGFYWDDIVILNPFSSTPHALVKQLLANPMQ